MTGEVYRIAPFAASRTYEPEASAMDQERPSLTLPARQMCAAAITG
jgi:hypothetical protein